MTFPFISPNYRLFSQQSQNSTVFFSYTANPFFVYALRTCSPIPVPDYTHFTPTIENGKPLPNGCTTAFPHYSP